MKEIRYTLGCQSFTVPLEPDYPPEYRLLACRLYRVFRRDGWGKMDSRKAVNRALHATNYR